MADVALVCGAGGALGTAVVDAFAARGDHVVPAGRDVVDLTVANDVVSPKCWRTSSRNNAYV